MSSGKKLEGVIAHIEEDRLGVRLTGPSVGQGEHDGEGLFAAPPMSGLWVQPSDVTARSLTRLEELRLRRELGRAATTAGSSTTTASSTVSTPRTSRVPTSTPPRSSSSSSGPTASTTRSRLEELRARRQASQQETTRTPVASTPPPASESATTTTASEEAADEVASLRQQLTQTQQEKTKYQEQAESLQQTLATVQADQAASQQQVQTLQQEMQALQTKYDQALASQSLRSSSTAVTEDMQEEINALHRAKSEAQDNYETARQRVNQLESMLKTVQEQHEAASDELVQLRAQVRTLQSQQQQSVADEASKAVTTEQYKERAKRQAQEAAHQRAAQAWQDEKVQLEGNIEELVLDKEQLIEENQSLYDRLEEMKLDLETAQMEAEELRLEMEDVRAAAAATPSATATSVEGEGDDEKMQVLSYQNARLREALIRLREQSSLEKMTLQKELRQAEKQAQTAEELSMQVTQLKQVKARMEEEANDLKDMVEQGAAFEGMVEDLSDRVLSLEEDIVALQTTIREMEEAAELSAEVEEVQTEEIKSLWRDMEGRDAIIRNLEEAIKMQRRREEDFRRTVGNYRTTVETLKQEKQALLQVQQGAYGEKSEMMATSQKALARAAQLVTDAANLRKEKAQAAAKAMNYIVYKHLSIRLERLTPSSFVAAEVGAMKGELYACKVAGKASQSLEGIAESLTKHIQPALPPDENATTLDTINLDLSDDARQEVTTMLHQVDMAQVLVTASAELRRFVAGGQWPDLATPEMSVEIGAVLGHSVTELDSMLGGVFQSLKEEGALNPEQSNLGALQQMVNSTIQRISAEVDREDATLIDKNWNPPGWNLFRNASAAKFYCLGVAAAMSIVQADKDAHASPLGRLYSRVEQAATQSNNICFRLTNLDVQNSSLVASIEESVESWKNVSATMISSVRSLFFSSDGDLEVCGGCVEEVLKEMAKLMQVLRSAKLNPVEDESLHALSPEAHDPWECIAALVSSVRAIDGDHEDINHLIRARDIERRLEQAVENEPKLEKAESKILQLEKTLSSRSKEIAMQNTRLSELEKIVAKSSGSVGRMLSSEVKSVEEYNSLREENRVLTEAMDVLQRQVDEYENEIRVLKDFKSPTKRGAAARGTPRRAMTSVGDFGSPQSRLMTDEKQTSTGVLEATIFRPALQQALEESARWKSIAVASILDLPPLLPTSEEQKIEDERHDDRRQLMDAKFDYYMEICSLVLPDLTRMDKTPREQLNELYARSDTAEKKLETVYKQIQGKSM